MCKLISFYKRLTVLYILTCDLVNLGTIWMTQSMQSMQSEQIAINAKH